jgi:phosphatidylethanolamine-binding protein (PEBP) family uncharacterized protein
MAQKTHQQALSDERMAEIAQHLAALGEDLLNGKKPPADTPKRHLLAALIIAYTTKVMDYNVKRMHGQKAKEPPVLAEIVNDICTLFDYKGN